MAKRRAFTLVELLVVIGIIAVLIGILMPTLNKARQSASTTACLSNLHNLGMAFSAYAGNYKGSLPEGTGPDGLVTWVSLLAYDMSIAKDAPNLHLAQMGSADTNKALGIFLCPEAAAFTPTPPSHYSGHPWLLPDMGAVYPAGYPDPSLIGKARRTYRLARIPRSAETILVFDGTQAMGSDGSANAEGANIDGNRISGVALTPTNPGVTFLFPGYNNVDLSKSVDGGTNQDGPPSKNNSNIRWRHMHNTVANFLFVDGHAGSLRYDSETNTELQRKNVYVAPQ